MPDSPSTFFTADMLLDTMAEGVVVLDRSGVIRLWNRSMERMTGYLPGEAMGQHMSWLRAPDCLNSQQLAVLLREGTVDGLACLNGCECRMRNRAGESVPVTVNARALRNAAGEITGTLQTISDVRPMLALQNKVDSLQDLVGSDAFEGMVGRSTAIQGMFRQVSLAAGSDATVLVLGESGTGKELAASAIHTRSARGKQPLVTVNCGALSETLLESELFGHVKGAFTGAHRDREGRFAAADGSTLFLDEIGDISPAMQIRLLRVLQEGAFERVGDNRTQQVDVRVIAATNRDLYQEVQAGRFREDLYYRLRVFPIIIPPLRDRPDDLPFLTEHFVRRFALKTGKSIEGITPNALAAIMGYDWPGNIRELENALEYAFVVCQGNRIEITDLPPELRGQPIHPGLAAKSARGSVTAVRPRPGEREAARRTLSSPEKLLELLDAVDWNKAEAGRYLGVSRTAVWKWMKKHDLPLQREA